MDVQTKIGLVYATVGWLVGLLTGLLIGNGRGQRVVARKWQREQAQKTQQTRNEVPKSFKDVLKGDR